MVSARRMLTPCFRAVEMTERMAAQAAQVYTLPPEKFGAAVRDEYAKWAGVVKATGIKAEE